MKKLLILLVIIHALAATTGAQQGKNALNFGGEIMAPVGFFADYAKNGLGVSGKALFGVGRSGQLSFSAGYSSHKNTAVFGEGTATYNVIPFMAGYRHNLNGFFLEPQIGYASYGFSSGLRSVSEGALTWAAGTGYTFNNGLELGLRYQSGSTDLDSYSFLGFRVGYNIALGGDKSASQSRTGNHRN